MSNNPIDHVNYKCSQKITWLEGQNAFAAERFSSVNGHMVRRVNNLIKKVNNTLFLLHTVVMTTVYHDCKSNAMIEKPA